MNDGFWRVSADTKTCGSPLYPALRGGLCLLSSNYATILTYFQAIINKKRPKNLFFCAFAPSWLDFYFLTRIDTNGVLSPFDSALEIIVLWWGFAGKIFKTFQFHAWQIVSLLLLSNCGKDWRYSARYAKESERSTLQRSLSIVWSLLWDCTAAQQ